MRSWINVARAVAGAPDAKAVQARHFAAVQQVAAKSLAKHEQVQLPVDDFIYAGVYVRTVEIPPGGLITNVPIKIPTVVIVSGTVLVSVSDKLEDVEGWSRLDGYNVLQASAPRQQVFYSPTGAHMTMFFGTQAETAEEAEAEFTDEPHMLQTRRAECPA